MDWRLLPVEIVFIVWVRDLGRKVNIHHVSDHCYKVVAVTLEIAINTFLVSAPLTHAPTLAL